MKLPINSGKLPRLTRARLQALVPAAMYGYRRVKDATQGFAIGHHATCDTTAEPSAAMVKGACDAIIHHYRVAGYTLEDAKEQAAIFGRRFVVAGDRAPEAVNHTGPDAVSIDGPATQPDPELDATLDRIAAVIG